MKKNNHLSLGLKVGLVAASFTLPIIALGYFVVTTINANIQFSSQEYTGDKYQRPLEVLLDRVQQHEIVTNGSLPGATQTLETLANEINEGFEKLAQTEAQYGNDLQFTDEGLAKRNRNHIWTNLLKAQWQDIAAQFPVKGKDAAEKLAPQYDKLVQGLRDAITHVGDTSNLILDPDLDSYYMMDATLLALPQTQDRIAKIIRFGQNCLKNNKLTAEDRVQLAVYAAMLQEADLDRIKASIQTSLNEDANFCGVSPTLQPNVQPATEAFSTAMTQFIELIQKLRSSDKPSIDIATFTTAGLNARNASFHLWNVAVGELDHLLLTRVQNYQGDRAFALAGSGFALAISCVLAYVLTRSITKPLQALAESLGPGGDLLSNCVEMIRTEPENSDIICEELAAHISYMRAAVRRLVVMVRGGQYVDPQQVQTTQQNRPAQPNRELVEV